MSVDVRKKINLGSGGTLKKALRGLAEEVRLDLNNLGKLTTFLITNKEFLSKCIYAENKVIIPFDFDDDSFVIRIEDFSKGIFSKYSIYTKNKDYATYTKLDAKYNKETGNWDKKVDNTKVSKLMDYPRVKEVILKDYKITVSKVTKEYLLKKKLRYVYITQLDRRVSDIARDFGLSKEKYLTLVGNVSKVRENEFELYRAYQKRVVMDYDKGMTIEEIIKEYNTYKDPVYRAIKEQCHLINNKDKFEETVLRCYGEGMTINEVNQYFKPIARKFYTVDEFKDLIKTKGHPIRREKKYLTPYTETAIQLFREGCALEDLVHAVQARHGGEESQETYWRSYTRYLIGITEGKSGRLDFDTMHRDALDRLSVDREYGI